MKIKDIIEQLDKSDENKGWIDIYELGQQLDIFCEYKDPHEIDLKAYWIRNWMCTDTVVGVRAYFLNDEHVAISVQNGRKNYEKFYWTSEKHKKMVEDYLRKFIIEDDIVTFDPNEELDTTFTLDFANELLSNHKIYYNGKIVKIISEIKDDFYSAKNVIIRFKSGEKKVVEVKELDIKINII